MSRIWIFGLTLALVAAFPDVALACAVCFDSSDENRQAFLATTAFLSLLPLGMVGGAGLWLRKRSRDLDEHDSATSDGGRPEAEQ